MVLISLAVMIFCHLLIGWFSRKSAGGGGEMIMFNSENRFKNPKNRQFFSDFNEKSACVHAA